MASWLLLTLVATSLEVVSGGVEVLRPKSPNVTRKGLPQDWMKDAPPGQGVPAPIYAAAMTSIGDVYWRDLEGLQAHLREEQIIMAYKDGAEATLTPYLCCSEYEQARVVKAALETISGGRSRSAMNHRQGYCAISQLLPKVASSAHEQIHQGVRCSPVTHAVKEPPTLLKVSAGKGKAFGVELGPALQAGPKRALVVTMAPGSLPRHGGGLMHGNMRGGAKETRSQGIQELEGRWRADWAALRGQGGLEDLRQSIPWTRERSLIEGASGEVHRRLEFRAPDMHEAKSRSYASALELIGKRLTEGSLMDGDGGGEVALDLTCGWKYISFEHSSNDVVHLRGIHHEDHDNEFATACFMGLVGYLSAQPEVLHIQPEAKAFFLNKEATSYAEGSSGGSRPMLAAGLDGSGEVIGVADSGLDDSSCFFRDPTKDVIARSTITSPVTDPTYRKVIQHVVFGDEFDQSGHGTHVVGTLAGMPYSGWLADWQVAEEECASPKVMSCFGDCLSVFHGPNCAWNPERACPAYECDSDKTCEDPELGLSFPCFGDATDEIPAAQGMAPAAKIAFVDIGEEYSLRLPSNLHDIFDVQREAGARIHTNSWSVPSYNDPTEIDVQLDEYVHEHPDALIVFGVGNTGEEGVGSVNSPATSKTTMSVGSINNGADRVYLFYSNEDGGYLGLPPGEASFEISSFSSRGPVGDFYVKPDLVAPGAFVHSAKAAQVAGEKTCAIAANSGTSMSAPVAAGAAAQIRQYLRAGLFADFLYEEGECTAGTASYALGLCDPLTEPSGALIKAILINAARSVGSLQALVYGPNTSEMKNVDFVQGFGGLQMSSSIPTVDNPYPGLFVHDGVVASDSSYYYVFEIMDDSADLSVTLAWYDPPSTVVAYSLLHDLDLTVISAATGTVFRSNAYDALADLCGANPSEAGPCAVTYGLSADLADETNTVERVYAEATRVPPGYYVAKVRAKGLTESLSGTQAYGVAAAGGGLVLRDSGPDLTILTVGDYTTPPASTAPTTTPTRGETFAPLASPPSLGPTPTPYPSIEPVLVPSLGPTTTMGPVTPTVGPLPTTMFPSVPTTGPVTPTARPIPATVPPSSGGATPSPLLKPTGVPSPGGIVDVTQPPEGGNGDEEGGGGEIGNNDDGNDEEPPEYYLRQPETPMPTVGLLERDEAGASGTGGVPKVSPEVAVVASAVGAVGGLLAVGAGLMVLRRMRKNGEEQGPANDNVDLATSS
ncbi:unnamed protein product [Discosporangium mesarthrocarpum]